ncbi:hypothetical protein NKH71_29985, partial [Mesorhizobium sp. M0983]
GDCNVTTVPWPLALQSKRRSLSKTFCRTFRTLSKILMASVEVGQECGMPRVLRIFELGRTRIHDA